MGATPWKGTSLTLPLPHMNRGRRNEESFSYLADYEKHLALLRTLGGLLFIGSPLSYITSDTAWQSVQIYEASK